LKTISPFCKPRNWYEEITKPKGVFNIWCGEEAHVVENKYKDILKPYHKGVYIRGTPEPIATVDKPLFDNKRNKLTSIKDFKNLEDSVYNADGTLLLSKKYIRLMTFSEVPTEPYRGLSMIADSVRKLLCSRNQYPELLTDDPVYTISSLSDYEWLYDHFNEEGIEMINQNNLDLEGTYENILSEVYEKTALFINYQFHVTPAYPFITIGHTADVRALAWMKEHTTLSD